MPGWDGNGNFTRNYDWTDDRDSAIKVQASRFDLEHDTFAAGIQACLAKNGENAATADLDLGTYRYTNAGQATARTDLLRADQLQDGDLNYAVAGGTADAITVTLSPSITAYTEGPIYVFRPSADNATTTPTLDISGVGAKTIKRTNAIAVAAADIKQNRPALVTYDATDDSFVLLNPATAAGFTASSTDTLTNKTIDGDDNTLQDIPGSAIKANAIDETKLKDALIGDFTEVTITASDTILLGDADDSGNTKRDTVQGILDLVGSTGTILQVVRASKTDTFSGNPAAGTWTDITGLSASITLSSSSNRVIGIAIVNGTGSNAGVQLRWERGGSGLNVGDASSSRLQAGGTIVDQGTGSAEMTNTILYLDDAPGSTGPHTYQVQFTPSFSATFYLNRSESDPDNVQGPRVGSHILLLEIA